jgi:hypothetical protein
MMGREEASKSGSAWKSILPIALALAFGIGVCAGTLAMAKAEVARGLERQRAEFERATRIAVEAAVERKDLELRRAFKIQRGAGL